MEKQKKQIFLLGLVSLLNDFSSEIIMPILPLYLSSLGADGFIIGLLGGLRDGVANILKVVFGYVSDRSHKRRPFLFLGYGISAFFKFLIGFFTTPLWIVISATLERVGKGLRDAPRDALIADITKKGEFGRNFGLHRLMDNLGALLGAGIVLLLYMFSPRFDFRWTIMIAAGISLLSMLPLFWVKDSNNKLEIKETDQKRFSFKIKSLPKKSGLFIIVASVLALGQLSYVFFISKAKEAFGGSLAIVIPLALYLFFNIFYTAFAMPFGILFDRIGGRKTILIGMLCLCLSLVLLAYGHYVFFSLAFALYGVGLAATKANQVAFVGRLSNDSNNGTIIGLLHTSTGIALLIGNGIAGLIWKHSGINNALLFGICLIIASIVLLLLFWKPLSITNQTSGQRRSVFLK